MVTNKRPNPLHPQKTILSIFQVRNRHFLCHLPLKKGHLAAFVLNRFFAGIKIDSQQIKMVSQLPPNSLIVYATKYKNDFDFMCCHSRFQDEHLPTPVIGLDYRFILWQPVSRFFRSITLQLRHLISRFKFQDPYESGYIEERLTAGDAGLISLVEKKGFYRRFVKAKIDPLRYLVELQNRTERPIFILPSLIFFDRSPQKSTGHLFDTLFRSRENTSTIRHLFTLLQNPEKVFIEISNPVDLQSFLQAESARDQGIGYQSIMLRRYLLAKINRHRQTIIGPTLTSPEEFKESILTSDHLQNYMDAYAREHSLSINQVHKKSDAYLREIAARYKIGAIKFFDLALTWLFNTLYDGVTVNNDTLNQIKQVSQHGPVIFIPCHKSHIDYLILSYVLYHHNMPCPLVAAGKNLSFWPIGPLFRSAGAFFIRRTFKGAPLYAKVFVEYIRKLLKEGFNIEFFIEGGRSRTGKLILPKLGFLSILLEAYESGACEQMFFVPIFIGYDRILEENAYLHELEGGKKEPESLRQVLQARKFLKKRYGKIYIKFHQPLSLTTIMARYGAHLQQMDNAEKAIFRRNLGHRMINAINQVSVATPHALIAATLLNIEKRRFAYEYIENVFKIYLDYLKTQPIELADTLQNEPIFAAQQALASYVHRKFIEEIHPQPDAKELHKDLSQSMFKVIDSKRPALEYYKNNCIAFFVSGAFTAASILERNVFRFSASDIRSGYRFLQKLFKNEFAYDTDRKNEFFIRKNIKTFIDDTILLPHPTLPDTYDLTAEGIHKLKLFAVFLKPYFESYKIVLLHLQQQPDDADEKEPIKQVQLMGTQMYKSKQIQRNEALLKINFKNALDYFVSRGVKDARDAASIENYLIKIQSFLECM